MSKRRITKPAAIFRAVARAKGRVLTARQLMRRIGAYMEANRLEGEIDTSAGGITWVSSDPPLLSRDEVINYTLRP